MNFNGSFEEALAYIAERRVFRKTAAPAEDAQSARQTLGILGADPRAIETAISGLNSGALSPGAAVRKIRGGVPGTFSQIKNIPRSIGVALQQGRPDDALAAADVVGLKNVLPGDNFSPTAFVLAGGAGAATAVGQHTARKHRAMYDILHGQLKPPADSRGKGKKAPSVGITGADPRQLKAWRAANIPPEFPLMENVNRAVGVKNKAMAAMESIKDKARRAFIGPTAGELAGSSVSRRALAQAADRTPWRPRGAVSKMLPFGVAAIPLLLKEWYGGGYRSGKQPAQQLVEANQAMHRDKNDSGIAGKVRSLFGGK